MLLPLPLLLLPLVQITDAVGQLCDSAFAGLDSGPSMVDCDKVHTLPDVSFTIQGRVFTLKPHQYILKVMQQRCDGVDFAET